MGERHIEPSTAELIEAFIANRGGRYVLIGSNQQVEAGNALIFDSVMRMVCGIDENSDLHRDVVRRMLAAGAQVASKTSSVPTRSPSDVER